MTRIINVGGAVVVAMAAVLLSGSVPVRSQCFAKNDRFASLSVTSSANLVLNGYANFTFSLYKSICREGDLTNVFFSPISVWSALVASFLGARNNTAVELADVLGISGMDMTSIANAYKMLRFAYNLRSTNTDANYTFQMANKIFFQLDEPIRQCILDYFMSEVVRVNFAAFPELSRQTINNWVAEQTKNKITNLLPVGYIDSSTRMVLVNAAYFKGDWQLAFDEELTRQDKFYVDSKNYVTIPMMNLQETYHYGKFTALKCAALELPYSGNEISMLILLPDVNIPVDSVMAKLSTQMLRLVIGKIKPQTVSLSLPKFSLEQAVDLEYILADLGIHDLFDPQNADLSGFTGLAGLSVDSVRHKAFVEVNEKGTEAAAATALISFRKGVSAKPFHVTRPFIFLIRDNVLDVILFMGLVRNPLL